VIKEKNLADEMFLLKKAGVVAATTGQDYFLAPFNGFITAIVAGFGLMGTDGTGSPTQDLIADIMKNGTTIFSGAGKISWAHAGQLGTANTPSLATSYAAMTTDPPAVSKGDKIRLDVTQILNGTSPTQPSDIYVYVVLSKKLGESAPSACLRGSIDPNN
jgi:hypothetical protein